MKCSEKVNSLWTEISFGWWMRWIHKLPIHIFIISFWQLSHLDEHRLWEIEASQQKKSTEQPAMKKNSEKFIFNFDSWAITAQIKLPLKLPQSSYNLNSVRLKSVQLNSKKQKKKECNLNFNKSFKKEIFFWLHQNSRHSFHLILYMDWLLANLNKKLQFRTKKVYNQGFEQLHSIRFFS